MVNDKLKLEIEICDIDVGESYYSIAYLYTINGKKKKGNLDGDFDTWTIQDWEKELKNGEALRIVLQEITNNY